MGGGLAFLNKKGWHPGSMRNQETVWKREQERDTEDRKLEEFRQHVEQERQKEELDGLARAAGVKKQSDRLDWMYQGGMVARTEADKRSEEAAQQQLPPLPSGIAVTSDQGLPAEVQLPSFLVEDNPASANEVWLRLHSDPLFAIRQQEIAARKSVLANPVQMDAIRKQAMLAAQAKAARKAARKQAKQAKREKKEARKANKHCKPQPSSESGSEPEQLNGNLHPEVASAGGHGRQQREYPEYPADTAKHSRADQHDRSSRHDSSRSHHAERSDRHDTAAPSSRDRADGARDLASDRSGRGSGALGSGGHSHSAVKGYSDQYGLKLSKATAGQDRSAASAATRQRLEDAAKAREEQRRLDVANKFVRKDYKTNQISEEDRAQKLAEMTGNASVHEEARWQRLSNARKRDHAEAAPTEDDHDAARFRKVAAQQVQGSQSVEQGVGRRKYYSERDNGGNAFRR